MSSNYSVTVGTCGRGTWNSQDGGETWGKEQRKMFVEDSPIVRALTLHPTEPHTLLAGADNGLFRSQDSGKSWEQALPRTT